jgi:hypothetical protein
LALRSAPGVVRSSSGKLPLWRVAREVLGSKGGISARIAGSAKRVSSASTSSMPCQSA